MFFVFSFLRTVVFELFYDIVVSNKDRNSDGRTVQGSRSYTNESDNGMRAGAATHKEYTCGQFKQFLFLPSNQ